MSTPGLALRNLRTVVIVIVVAVHAVVAYLGSSPASSFNFDAPPYRWRSIPIVDSERWFGFDIFCAFQDVYLISLLFFLSGLFVWPSLMRSGSRIFLRDRLLRIGPPWFLWVLLVFDFTAAVFYLFAPASGEAFGRSVGQLGACPRQFVTVLLSASAVAYVPLALVFNPWDWFHVGPFSFQLCRPLHYLVYFFAGAGVGAYRIERGLLATDGWLVRRWAAAGVAAMAAFMLWLGMAGLAMMGEGPPP